MAARCQSFDADRAKSTLFPSRWWVPLEPVSVSQSLLSQLAIHAVGLVLLAVSSGRPVIWTVLWVRVLGRGHKLANSCRGSRVVGSGGIARACSHTAGSDSVAWDDQPLWHSQNTRRSLSAWVDSVCRLSSWRGALCLRADG
jgi:hypothetical protein